MTYTLVGTIVFDDVIAKWDVSISTDMTHVFAGAAVVGADISNATDMTLMFTWRRLLKGGRVESHRYDSHLHLGDCV